MHTKQSGRENTFTERLATADNDSTAGIINGYQPRVEDVVQKVAVTSFTVQSK